VLGFTPTLGQVRVATIGMLFNIKIKIIFLFFLLELIVLTIDVVVPSVKMVS
jgi:hypothetical protein